MKEQMILAYERGECGYYESYDYVRERMADQADLLRKQRREERVVAMREDGSLRTEPDEEPSDWRER